MTIDDIRARNARVLARSAGTNAAFAKKIGMDSSQVSQLIGRNPVKHIGDSIARRIENAFDKPRGWMDIDCSNDTTSQSDVTLSIADRELLDLVSYLTDQQRESLVEQLKMQKNQNEAIFRAIQNRKVSAPAK